MVKVAQNKLTKEAIIFQHLHTAHFILLSKEKGFAWVGLAVKGMIQLKNLFQSKSRALTDF